MNKLPIYKKSVEYSLPAAYEVRHLRVGLWNMDGGRKKKIQHSIFNLQYSSYGFTLIETLVVLSVFSILAVLVTSVIIYSLRGTRKSENTSKVRAQLNEAVEVVERQLKNAKSVDSVVSSGLSVPQTCDDPSITFPITGSKIWYTDQSGTLTYFGCGTSSIASGSATLANQGITITTCSFTYTNPCKIGVPENVTFKVGGYVTGVSGPEAAAVSVETNIQLRNY